MSTYKDVIDQIEREVRIADAFPDASTKAQEQVDVIHRYAVALAKNLPLSRLKIEKSVALTSALIYDEQLREAAMPADTNETREDLGISMIEFAYDSGASEMMSIFESVGFESLKAAITNFYQQNNFLMAVSVPAKKVYYPEYIPQVFVHYARAFAKPATADVATTDIALDANAIDVLVEAACSHFTSVNARDLSASQIHATLSAILKE